MVFGSNDKNLPGCNTAMCEFDSNDNIPAALTAYDIPLPRRERSMTFPTVDFHLWKARRKLLGDQADDYFSNSNGSSCETMSDIESLPAALCAYDIPLPTCGHSYEHMDAAPLPPSTPPRGRSVTLPASDLQKFRLRKLLKMQRDQQRVSDL